MLIFAPDGDQYPKPSPNGCFFASDLIVHVMCKETWNDKIISGILSWALYWTFESPIVISLMAVSKTILGITLVVLWLASLILALSFLVRQIGKLRQKTKSEVIS